MAAERILVAPAWPYAAGPRHLGHVSGFAVPADVFARYHRLKGNDVLMVSGTDEHGTPVMVQADKEGSSYGETAARYNLSIREDLRGLGISYDCFSRTTTPNHARVTQDIFKTLYEHGCLIEQEALGAFSSATGNTLPDRYIEGTCPHCGYEHARGDQCDNCGRQLDPIDLINPRSRIDGSTPEFRTEKHLFLDLPQFAERLEKWVSEQTHWRPNVRNFSLGVIRDLKPRPITRDLDWGVPIPVPGYEDRENKRIYVWFDAVIGYLSASIEWAENEGRPDAWREWWQNPESRHFYFQGKDNIVFHTVIWPANLMGYGSGGEYGAGKGDLQLPYNVVASEYLTMEGKQFSSSRSVGILIKDVLERYDPDPIRYYLTAAGPESQDTDFTWAEFVRRNNDELLANWGNLVNRTLTIAHRNFGEIPQPGILTAEDKALIDSIEAGFGIVGEQIELTRFRSGLAEAMRLATLVNQYLNEQAPWQLLPDDRDRAATVLYVCLRCIDNLKLIFAPFLPFTSQTVHELLGYDGWIAGPLEFQTHEDGETTHEVLTGDYDSWVGGWAPVDPSPGQKLPEPRPLYRKLEPSVVEEELERMRLAADE